MSVGKERSIDRLWSELEQLKVAVRDRTDPFELYWYVGEDRGELFFTVEFTCRPTRERYYPEITVIIEIPVGEARRLHEFLSRALSIIEAMKKEESVREADSQGEGGAASLRGEAE